MSTDSHEPASPAPQPAARRPRAVMIAGAIFLFALLTLILGRSWFEKYDWGRSLLNQTVGNVGLGSGRDFVLVSAAIDESLYDKSWKLVRWWPGRKSAKLHEDSVEALRRQLKDNQEKAERAESKGLSAIGQYHRGHAQQLEAELQKMIDQEPSTICRIRYEVLVAGEPDLRDQIFVIDNDTAWAVPLAHEAKARAEFPE